MEVSATSGRADGGELGNRHLEIRSSYLTRRLTIIFAATLMKITALLNFEKAKVEITI
jgi:hypothetical protein